jgi:hypothetical protein
MFQQHATRGPVKAAVKVTRKAVNRALDAAEPKLESAAAELEDLSRDAYKALRRTSVARLDDLKDGYGKLERRVRKELPKVANRKYASKNAGKIALVTVGVIALAIGIFR